MQNKIPDLYTTREHVEALLKETREEALLKPGSRRRAKKRKTRSGLQQVFHVTANILYVAVIALLLVVLYIGIQAKMHNQHASILGYSIYTVETGSMVPTLPIGSYIVTHTPEDPAALPVGTVITFLTEKGSTITHRIIEVLNEDGIKYRTKGDNPQNSPDLELVTPDRVLGMLQFSVSLPKMWQEQG